jgi:uncharacterized repeat protein (TIGR03803 family)
VCLQSRELIQASDGHLYGTTRSGGPDGAGVLFRRNNNADDIEFAPIDDGARVTQYTPHGGANQQWLLRPVESTAAPVTVSER